MGDQKINQLSRRRLLKGGAALIGASLLFKSIEILNYQQVYSPANPKRIYIAPDDHTDYFWTADEETYRQVFLETIDYYLDLADETANEPPEFQSRWACDGSFWMWTYEKNKPAADFQRLINRIKSGHISVPLNALCVCLGGAPVEAVLRGMYYPSQIERRYKLRFHLAYMIENQTMPYGIISLWTGAGAKYSWKGICRCDSLAGTYPVDIGDREHSIYWWVGPDGSKLLMKWYTFFGHYSLGGYAEALDPVEAIELADADPDFISHYPYHVIGLFGKGGDGVQTLTDEFVAVAKSQTKVGRQIIVSNQQDFFEDFEAAYAAEIPSLSCSFGNDWDLYCVELAEVSARVKRAVEKLRGAEAIATLVNLQNPEFMDGRQPARDLAWMDLGLFWEHDFGMVKPPTGAEGIQKRIAWQRRLASEIEGYVDTLYADAVAALAGMIRKSGPDLRFYVFNPLSWERTDVADLPYAATGLVHVIDLSTGQETPSQIVYMGEQQYLRVLAQNVPPVGYKVFAVRSGTGQKFPETLGADDTTGSIYNSLYQLIVAPRGAIVSLIDKTRSHREFIKTIEGRAVNDLGPGSGILYVENSGPVSVTLRAEVTSPLNHTTRITLIRDSPRIDIRNDINQNFNETYTWSFGFELEPPDVWHEEVGAVIRAKTLAEGGHYAPRNARYDWLTLNHFGDMNDGVVGVTLSNADCYFMRLGNSADTSGQDGFLDTSTPQISILVGGREGGEKRSDTGIFDQGGDTYFLQRFALQTHEGYDSVKAMKFALEHQNPLVTGVITGGSVYPEISYSLLTLDNPKVLLWALKPADDGIEQGIITRVWNLAVDRQNFSLTLSPRPILQAKRTTHLETPLEPAPVTEGALAASLNAHQLKTFSLSL